MEKGIIISASSNLYQVETNQKIYACLARGKFKKEKITPLVGDFVQITITDETKKEGVIEEILPRKNMLKRPKMANLTQLLFVVSMQMPKPDLLLLDKQLAFSEFLGLKSVICFNKTDLVEKAQIQKITSIYEKIGYPVITTIAQKKGEAKKLIPFFKNQITALAGNSGVGKSTLLNGLFEEDLTQEGMISYKNKKGKNTTTSVTLYPYEENTYIADTPGFSTFEVSEIPKEDLAHYFIEFVQHLKNCEFDGCSHTKETNCGIKQAVEQGKISMARYENYQKIYQELKQWEEKRW